MLSSTRTFGKFHKTDWQKEEKMINLHVVNTTHLTKLFLKDMVKKNDGKIMNISSVAAFQPGPLMSLYYATKAYILHFTEAIANEVKDNIRLEKTTVPAISSSIIFSDKLFKISVLLFFSRDKLFLLIGLPSLST